MRIQHYLSLGCILTAACIGCSARGTPLSASVRSTNTIVTAGELANVRSEEHLLGALQVLRPWFFTVRASPPLVSVDSLPPGDMSLLRSISLSTVSEVRLLRRFTVRGRPLNGHSANAAARQDVILVLTRYAVPRAP